MLYIYGYGGFAREVKAFLPHNEACTFLLDESYFDKTTFYEGDSVIAPTSFQATPTDVFTIGIGDPLGREKLANTLRNQSNISELQFTNLHLQGSYIGHNNKLGVGNIFCPGNIITTNVTVGNFCHFNLHSTIGHDCVIGDYTTVSPGVNVSGNCKIGKRVYLGTNCALREGVSICDDVVIGMGSVVVSNITEPGVYVGIPCKKIK